MIKSLQVDLNTWAPGIEIISIRVTKPRIPERIRANFESMEQTKVEYMIISERQKVLGDVFRSLKNRSTPNRNKHSSRHSLDTMSRLLN